MATKSSIHIKPCNIASSEAHNRRTAELMLRQQGLALIYLDIIVWDLVIKKISVA